MKEFNIGDNVYLAGFQSETGVIESRINGTNDYMVRLDKDFLLIKVNYLDMSLGSKK